MNQCQLLLIGIMMMPIIVINRGVLIKMLADIGDWIVSWRIKLCWASVIGRTLDQISNKLLADAINQQWTWHQPTFTQWVFSGWKPVRQLNANNEANMFSYCKQKEGTDKIMMVKLEVSKTYLCVLLLVLWDLLWFVSSGWLQDYDHSFISRISMKASAVANLSLDTAEQLQVWHFWF